MEINYDVTTAEDTLFLVDLCPKQNFPQGSKEDILAQQWLNYLCTYEANNLDEKRLRNIYLSHLCSALIEKRLYGPFVKEPPKGKLEKIDFHAAPICPQQQLQQQISPLEQPSNVAMTSMAGQPTPSSSTVVNATQNLRTAGMESHGYKSVDVGCGAGSTCFCPPKPCQCSSGQPCSCNRSLAGADTTLIHDEEVICNYLMQKLKFTPDYLNKFDLTFLMDLCKEVPLESKSQTPSKSQLPLETSINQVFLNSQHSVDETNAKRDTVKKLLAAVVAELSGDVDPGCNDYLDHILARYKTFVTKNSNMSIHLSSLNSNQKIRSCLLLSLQNYLVKCLSELK